MKYGWGFSSLTTYIMLDSLTSFVKKIKKVPGISALLVPVLLIFVSERRESELIVIGLFISYLCMKRTYIKMKYFVSTYNSPILESNSQVILLHISENNHFNK